MSVRQKLEEIKQFIVTKFEEIAAEAEKAAPAVEAVAAAVEPVVAAPVAAVVDVVEKAARLAGCICQGHAPVIPHGPSGCLVPGCPCKVTLLGALPTAASPSP